MLEPASPNRNPRIILGRPQHDLPAALGTAILFKKAGLRLFFKLYVSASECAGESYVT